MAKTPAAQASKPANKTTTTVIYSPIDDSPATCKIWGITFRANVPVEFDPKNRDHYVMQLLPTVHRTADGEVRTKHADTPVFIPECARGNFQFVVDGVRAKRRTSTRKVPPPGAEWTDAHEGVISDSEVVDVAATRDFMTA